MEEHKMPLTLKEAHQTAESSYESYVLNNLFEEIAKGTDLTKSDIFGRCLLSEAMEQALFTVSAVLIENGVSLVGSSTDYSYPLPVMHTGSLVLMKAYRESKRTSHVNSDHVYGALATICTNFDEENSIKESEKLRNILNAFEIDLNTFESNKRTLIYVVIEAHAPSALKVFLDHGYNPDIVSESGQTPYNFAVQMLLADQAYSKEFVPLAERTVRLLEQKQ
jgi:hypothetical protein